MRGRRWLNVAALVTWLICGLPQIVAIAQGRFEGWPAAMWTAAFLLYGFALILFLGLVELRSLRGYHFPLVVLIVQMVSALAVVMLPVLDGHSTNSTPALLVVIAAQLPYLAPPDGGTADHGSHVRLSPAWIWSLLAGLTLINVAVLFVIERSWADALSFGLSIGGFILFAAASSFLVRSEAAARDQLATANRELLATRARLAESSRAEERLRISRDLHDALGHHLTALSLQLDVAARISEGKTADHIRQAHAITRLLLADVRDVVSSLRGAGQLDLGQAIRAMAAEHAAVTIHLELPETFSVVDASRADILLRSVQEIITNTARHARAQNLWIRLEPRTDGIALYARDDGRGVDVVACGNGLTGMRERFEQYAGHVEFTAGQGTGFEVRGFLPTPAAA
jgi:signal transduction histidine kinase